MNITDVRIRTIRSADKSAALRAVVSVTFDDMFAVHDMKIIDGPRGMFVAMPNRRIPNGEYRDIAHPTTSEARREIEKTILDAYARYCAENEDASEE